MKYISLASTALFAGVLAAPALSSTSSSSVNFPTYFTLVVSSPGNSIDGQSFIARDGEIFLGGAGPTVSCPHDDSRNCPKGNSTVFQSGNGSLQLAVLAEGEQAVFVTRRNQTMGYTAPASESTPENSDYDLFWIGLPLDGSQDMTLNWALAHNGSFAACPTVDGQYRIKAEMERNFFGKSCLEIEVLLAPAEAVGAYEYTGGYWGKEL